MAQNEITKGLANRLEELTERKRDIDYRLSDKKQAEQIGIPYPTFVKYKGNKAECPISTIVKMAKYYDVSTDYLLGRTETKTLDELIQAAVTDLGISEISAENIRSITRGGGNVDILLERDEFKIIMELLNKIKTIAVGRRYYNTVIVQNIESNCLLDSLFDSGDFNSHARLLSYITYAASQLLERQFNDDISVSGSLVKSQGNCDNLYKEKMVLTEYELTEQVFRSLINSIKDDTTTDDDSFNEFDNQIGDNLDYSLISLQSNLEDAPNHYIGKELDKRKQEMQEDIELLDKFIKFYNEHYRKDGESNG